MPAIPMTITRDNPIFVPRQEVEQGMVFAVRLNNDKLGKKYAAIGTNGRMYSVNLDSKELASSQNPDTRCQVLGSWLFDVNRAYTRGSRIGQAMTRADVHPGEVFVVTGGNDEYAHLGKITRAKKGWLSIPLARQGNHAVTVNGTSHVTVVGTFNLGVLLAK